MNADIEHIPVPLAHTPDVYAFQIAPPDEPEQIVIAEDPTGCGSEESFIKCTEWVEARQ